MARLWKLLPFIAILNGCYSDFSLWQIMEEMPVPEEAPNITVSPGSVDFGPLNADNDSASN